MTTFLSIVVRIIKMLSFSVCCSFITLLLQLVATNNEGFLHVMMLCVFLVVVGIDSYRFSSLYGTIEDELCGQLIPMIVCVTLVFVGYFCFSETLFNYLFMPMRALENLNFLARDSIILSSVAWLIVLVLMSWIGSMHPVEREEDYFAGFQVEE